MTETFGNSSIAARLTKGLTLPLIVAPMFLVSGPELIKASCRAGVIGALPALNARTPQIFDEWLGEIEASNAASAQSAPYAVNLIVHSTNMRIEEDVDICVKHQAPVIISSVGSPKRLIEKVHGYGGLVFSDASTVDYAKRGAQAGVDGLVLLCAGAGGNTGALNPFAFVSEVRRFFDGPIVLAGAISRGRFVRLAQEMGADMAMAGTSFIAARESLASDEYRDMLIQSGADDIVLTAEVTGIPANLLRHSLEKVGFASERGAAGFNLSHEMSVLKAWRDIWSAGHGVGDVDLVEPAAEIVARFRDDYFHAGQPRAAA